VATNDPPPAPAPAPAAAADAQSAQVNLHQLLRTMVQKGASDLHVTTGTPPQFRIDGTLVPLKLPNLMPADTKQLCYSILTEEQKVAYETNNELDLSFGVKNLARFRANIFRQRGAVAGAFRTIPFRIPSWEELGLPPVVAEMAAKPRGLVLITGPTGCGKSTTLASLLDRINNERRLHVITIEDPIEYLHSNKNCIINQREVGTDTNSFPAALKYVLRQDPDVVLVGEMRDLETISAALTISETGHLVFATLHTNSCVQSVNRMIDVFPEHQQAQVRAQISFVLEGVVTQQLLPRADGPGRVLACEVMVPNAAIRNLIREDKIHQLYTQMQVGQDKYGMITLNQSLFNLAQRRLITVDEAFARTGDVDELKAMFQNAQAQGGRPAGAAGSRRAT
jgi:twitching motility protein PilT